MSFKSGKNTLNWKYFRQKKVFSVKNVHILYFCSNHNLQIYSAKCRLNAFGCLNFINDFLSKK